MTVASVGGAYQFARVAAANLREKEDHWNAAWGGLFGGAAIGLRGLPCPLFSHPSESAKLATSANMMYLLQPEHSPQFLVTA